MLVILTAVERKESLGTFAYRLSWSSRRWSVPFSFVDQAAQGSACRLS